MRLKDYLQSFPAGRQRTVCAARVSRFATAATDLLASGGGFGMLPGQDGKRPGIGLAVVLGQDLAETGGAIGDRAVADLAACHGKMGNGDAEAVGPVKLSSTAMMPGRRQ
jgi:hypothetical protein